MTMDRGVPLQLSAVKLPANMSSLCLGQEIPTVPNKGIMVVESTVTGINDLGPDGRSALLPEIPQVLA